jgi:hypothetical protein
MPAGVFDTGQAHRFDGFRGQLVVAWHEFPLTGPPHRDHLLFNEACAYLLHSYHNKGGGGANAGYCV